MLDVAPTASRSLRRRSLFAATLGVAIGCAPLAAAQPASDPVREASRHFRRGVELYGEANYAGALVEFRRAYALAPSAAALYDAGEAQYQLQDYAGALQTFRRYLAESSGDEPHRAEVENDVRVLQTRVAHLRVTTSPAGAEVFVDDRPAGKTPFAEPLLVSVGRHKLVASLAGRRSVEQSLDVAAGDDVAVTLWLAEPALAPAAGAGPAPSASASDDRSSARSALTALGWVTTGALAAGAATFGVLALLEAHALSDARQAFPGSAATLAHDSSLTGTYAVLADGLGAAALVVGGLSLYWTLSSPSPSGARAGGEPRVRLAVGPASARASLSF